MGAVQKPYDLKVAPWIDHPQEEFDLDASLDEDPTLLSLMVEIKQARRASVVICIDTSLSMTGKKLALIGVALAVLALQLEPEDYAVVAFETEANLIKPLGEDLNLHQMLERFLEVPARGLTNIEAGLALAGKQLEGSMLPKKHVILMSDGRFTAGKSPEHIVPGLPRLHVVQTGSPWSSPRFCRNLARKGQGKYVRVTNMEQLPTSLYQLVSGIIR